MSQQRNERRNAISTGDLSARREADRLDRLFLYSIGALAMNSEDVQEEFVSSNPMRAAAAHHVGIATLSGQYPHAVAFPDGLRVSPKDIGSDAALLVARAVRDNPVFHDGI